jgi:hypothetical protein
MILQAVRQRHRKLTNTMPLTLSEALAANQFLFLSLLNYTALVIDIG